MEIDGLIRTDNISSHLISIRRRPIEYRTVKKYKRQELEQDGWEFVPSKLTKTIRMKKPKSHFHAFEDRIWALLAKMKFEYINQDTQFELEYKPGLTKRIDVFAADNEAILIIECKSSATRKKVSYQKDINELISMKEGLRDAAQKLIMGKPKVAFLFVTNNSVLIDNDRKRLSEDSIFHFNEANVDYWEQLTDHLGPAAKYQLFGKLFAGQNIPNLPNRVPAIKGKMSSGVTFYSFSIDPMLLLRMAFVLHRTETDYAASEAYQRLVNKKRLGDIGKYIDQGGYFPNSIIVNIDTRKKKDIKFEFASSIEHDSDTSLGVLHLPRVYRSAFIIDGQHRLYGYSRSKSKSHQTVPVVAFNNLPEPEQARIFIDINHLQKSVPANLLRSIMADFYWNSDDAHLALQALKTRLLTSLNYDDSSPFYKKIVLAEEKKTDTRSLTLETLLKWGLSSKMGFFGKVKGKQLIRNGYLTDVSYEETLNKSFIFFRECFGYIEGELNEQWNAGIGEGGFIGMNIGVSATFRTIDQILDYLGKLKNLCPEDLSGQELAQEVIPYLIPVAEFIKGLTPEEIKKLRSYFGSGATEKVLMEFLQAIHVEFEEFNPKGLDQWIKEHTGEFNLPSWDLGNNHIEPLIDGFIKQQLKKEYGENAWWNRGISKEIQKSCSDARIDAGSDEPDHNFLCTIHYRTIILDNWPLLCDYFTPPGMENIKKDKRLSWLVKLNAVRQRYSHPQRDVITEDEYSFLYELYEWLKVKLS